MTLLYSYSLYNEMTHNIYFCNLYLFNNMLLREDYTTVIIGNI